MVPPTPAGHRGRLVEAARFQILEALLGMLFISSSGAEDDCSGRQAFTQAGPDQRHPVGHSAFIRFLSTFEMRGTSKGHP